MYPMFKNVARIVAVAAVTVGSGVMAVTPPALADIGADMRFVCSGESGTHQVDLRIRTNAPSSGAVGQPIQLGTIRIDVAVPEGLVNEALAKSLGRTSKPPVTSVAPSPAASPAVEGVAEMKVAISEPGRDRRGGWPAFALAGTSERNGGAVHLTGSGVAPPVVPRSPGGLSWAVGKMALSLTKGDTTTAGDSTQLALRCAAEKEMVLGSVRVRQGGKESAPNALSALQRQVSTPQEDLCEVIPPAGADPHYAINHDPELWQIFEDPPTPDGLEPEHSTGVMNCIKATGFVNVKKADAAIPIATETLLRRGINTYNPSPFVMNYFEYHGYTINRTYRIPSTILGFGFMPTRAVTESFPVRAPGDGPDDPITGNFRLTSPRHFQWLPDVITDSTLQASAYQRLKIETAEINGVPIHFGDKCMTDPTLLLAKSFVGNWRVGWVEPIQEGSTIIAEDLKIPPFSGCGVTEDLSPILTAAVSGSGNYLNVDSGGWCDPTDGSGCVNDRAPLPTTWTIDPGGDIVAVAEPFILGAGDPAGLACESATMRFHLDRGQWQPRFRLGKAAMAFENCKVTDEDGVVRAAEVTPERPVWLNGSGQIQDGRAPMGLNGIRLDVSFPGDSCELRIAGIAKYHFLFDREGWGSIHGTFDNGTDVLSAEGGDIYVSPKTTCNVPGLPPVQRISTVKADFVFDSDQTIIQD